MIWLLALLPAAVGIASAAAAMTIVHSYRRRLRADRAANFGRTVPG